MLFFSRFHVLVNYDPYEVNFKSASFPLHTQTHIPTFTNKKTKKHIFPQSDFSSILHVE